MNSRLKWIIVGSSTCLVVLLLAGAVNGRAVSDSDVYGHLKVYTEVLQRIKMEYVEEPDMKGVTLGAINGLLESVDPYSSYLNADQYRQYEKNKDLKKAGVGLVLSKRMGYLAVIDAIPGSPAAKANLSSGDLIEAIGGVATRDMPLAFAEQLLTGDPGSTVEISAVRLRSPEPQKLTLTRAATPYPAVTAKMLPNEVGYLQVQSLEGSRVTDTKSHVQELKKQGAKYLILDLRHCATGVQQNGVPLANLFLDKGEIGYVEGQKTARQNFQADPQHVVWSGPLAVIANRSTAGGAEIAAAALLDSKRAKVVGERTYGDASIRKTVQMDDGGAIILSVAKYYSPSGKAIQDTGVTPSVQVAEADSTPDLDDKGNPLPESPSKPTEDTLLKQAIEVVTAKTNVASSGESGSTEIEKSQNPRPQPLIHKKQDQAPN